MPLQPEQTQPHGRLIPHLIPSGDHSGRSRVPSAIYPEGLPRVAINRENPALQIRRLINVVELAIVAVGVASDASNDGGY